MEPKKVILDFSVTDYSDAEACDERNLVHRSKLDDFMRVFAEQLALAKDEMRRWNDDKREIRNIHNAISIYASRGAGKTTFLLSAIKKVQMEYGDDVVCLETIDPSLMDTKQKPIVNIIAAIHEKVRETGSDITIYSSKEKADLAAKLDQQYKAVLKALPFIDGIGKDPVYADWDDEEYIANQGIPVLTPTALRIPRSRSGMDSPVLPRRSTNSSFSLPLAASRFNSAKVFILFPPSFYRKSGSRGYNSSLV